MATLTSSEYNALFDKLREIVKWYYRLSLHQRYALDGLADSIYSAYNPDEEELSNFVQDVTNLRASYSTFRERLIAYWESSLAELAPKLSAPNGQPVTVLNLLMRAMLEDSQSIRARTVEVHPADLDTDGTLLPHTDNVGTSKVVAYAYNNNGLPEDTNRRAFNELLQVVCTTNSIPGRETFTLSGRANVARNSMLDPGSGPGPTITSALNQYVANGDFESWNGDEANNWTITGGTWGTDANQGTAFAGNYSLEFGGTCALVNSQAFTLTAGNVVILGVWVNNTSADNVLEWSLVDGEGNTVATLPPITLDTSGTWTFQSTILAPVTLNRTVYLKVACTTYDAAFSIDNVQLVNGALFNNLYWAVFAGDKAAGIGDTYGFGAASGVQIQAQQVHSAATTADSGTANTLVFTGSDVTARFPVGTYVQHPTTHMWHRISASSFSTDTTVTFASSSAVAWPAGDYIAYREGLIQQFLSRLYNVQLPASTTPTQEDPTL